MTSATALTKKSNSRTGSSSQETTSSRYDLFDLGWTPGLESGSLDVVLHRIPSERHMLVIESFVDRWIERKDALDHVDPVIHRLFYDDRQQWTHTTSRIFIHFMKTMNLRSLAGVDQNDSVWLAQRAANQIPDAARWIRIAGESIKSYTLCSRMNWSSEQIDDLESNNKVLSFQSFEWKWYPIWQFDFGNRRIYPTVNQILGRYFDGTESRAENIMYWAIRPNEQLSNLSPYDWIRQQKPKSVLFKLLDEIDFEKKPNLDQSKLNDTSRHSSEKLSTNSELTNQIEYSIRRLKTKIEQLRMKKHIYCHIPNYIESVIEIGSPPVELSDLQLKLMSRSIVDEFIIGYVAFGTYLQQLLLVQNAIGDLSEANCEWLGKISAKKVESLSVMIKMLSPRLTEEQVIALLECSKDQLDESEIDNQLISFQYDQHRWFPRWQFDMDKKNIRPIVIELLQLLKPPNGIFDNFMITSWFASRNSDGLSEHMTPAEWLERPDTDPTELIPVAERFLDGMRI